MKVFRNKRAFTLLELVIAGVVTMVMMVMVISFSVMTHRWATVGQARYDLLASERLAQTALVDYLSYYDCTDYYVRTSGDDIEALSIAEDRIVGKFVYKEGALSFTTPDGVSCVYPLTHITAVRFGFEYSETTKMLLIRMRLDYVSPSTNAQSEEYGVYNIVQTARAVGVHA